MQEQEVRAQARYIMTSGRCIWEWILKIQADHLSALSSKEKGRDLSMAQYQMLLLLDKRGKTTMSELAAELGVTVPSASAMVDRLVERDILIRRQARYDRRKVEVSLTRQARETVAHIDAVIFDSFLELVQAVGQDTSRQWCRVLERVKTCLPEEQ